jgi:hypothetical protein
MAVLPDYVTGTITLANGSTTVTGTGTMFTTAAFRPGDTLQIQNLTAIIASVNSNTSLTLTVPWTGTSLTNAPYRARYLPDGARVTAQTTTLIELLGNGNLQALAAISLVANKWFATDASAVPILRDFPSGDALAQMVLGLFGNYAPSSTNTDLNSLVAGDRGLYTWTAGGANFPENSGLWWVETQAIYNPISTTAVRQTATRYNPANNNTVMYVRTRNSGGAWGQWLSITGGQFGSNSNGSFYRYADGTQLMYRTVTPDWGIATYQDYTYPATAIAALSQTVVIGDASATNAALSTAAQTVNRPLLDRFRFAFRGTLSAGDTTPVTIMALTRWF